MLRRWDDRDREWWESAVAIPRRDLGRVFRHDAGQTGVVADARAGLSSGENRQQRGPLLCGPARGG